MSESWLHTKLYGINERLMMYAKKMAEHQYLVFIYLNDDHLANGSVVQLRECLCKIHNLLIDITISIPGEYTAKQANSNKIQQITYESWLDMKSSVIITDIILDVADLGSDNIRIRQYLNDHYSGYNNVRDISSSLCSINAYINMIMNMLIA